jgi:sialate O-acetylesterase
MYDKEIRHCSNIQIIIVCIDKIYKFSSTFANMRAYSLYRLIIVVAFIAAGILGTGNVEAQDLKLPGIFGSNMVMQRDTIIRIWGWGSAGEKVRIQIGNELFTANTTNEGKFEANMGPFQAGGPYKMTIKSGNEFLQIDSIYFGEVWLCGGQSNMQFTIDMLKIPPAEALEDRGRKIHFFNVQVDTDVVPAEDVAGGDWQVVNEKTIGNLSGTAYYFAKYLYDSLQVPIGLISSNLGATSIETWMSAEALDTMPAFSDIVKKTKGPGKNKAQLMKDLLVFRQGWDSTHYMNETGIKEKWYLPETKIIDWKEINIPNFWEYSGHENHDGFGWFRTEFDKPAVISGTHWHLALNQIAAYDIAWVNGVKVGETFGGRNWRNYFVPVELLKEKGNTLVVRIFDAGGLGGMYTNAFWGNPILNGSWKFKISDPVSIDTFPLPHVPDMSFFTHPTSLYNANIAPLTKYRIKGVIWYQGESNEARAAEYSNLLKTMVRDWRKQWNQGDFPFLVVQLANHRQVPEKPAESQWAELRASQMSVLELKNTGIASAIDIGDADDIHPRNKKTLGFRLAMIALEKTYQRKLNSMGPVFHSVKFSKQKAIIDFKFQGKCLVSKQKEGKLRGFAIAAEDGIFYYAEAILKGNSVEVKSELVTKPKYIRYAWADNPGPLDLYDETGLPAFPFRTDTLPLSTMKEVFKFDPYGF